MKGVLLVYIINRIRMSVFPSVCSQTPPREVNGYRHIIYGSIQNLSGKVVIYISNQSGHWFGRYWPKTGHW